MPSPVLTYGYNHLAPGHPDNPKTYNVCGAPTRNEAALTAVCLQHAGWGTAHPGVGRCKLHGGASLTGPDHPRWQGGRYAHAWRGRLREHFAQLQASGAGGDPLDLLPELEVQRVLLSVAIEDLGAVLGGDPGQDVDDPVGVDLLGLVDGQADGGKGVLQAGENYSDSDGANDSDINTIRGGVGEYSPNITNKDTQRLTRSRNFFTNEKEREELVQRRMETVQRIGDTIVKTVTQVINARNQTALTKAEMIWLQMKLKEGLERFIPDIEQRRSFLIWLATELPGGADAWGAEGSARVIELPAAGEAAEAD